MCQNCLPESLNIRLLFPLHGHWRMKKSVEVNEWSRSGHPRSSLWVNARVSSMQRRSRPLVQMGISKLDAVMIFRCFTNYWSESQGATRLRVPQRKTCCPEFLEVLLITLGCSFQQYRLLSPQEQFFPRRVSVDNLGYLGMRSTALHRHVQGFQRAMCGWSNQLVLYPVHRWLEPSRTFLFSSAAARR